MPIVYSSGAPVQSNPTFSGNTTNGASTTVALGLFNVTQLPFAAQTGLVAGQIITAPAAAAGAVILQASATAIQLDRILATAIASGTTVTAQDADGVFATGGTGVTVTTTGTTLGDQSRQIAFTAAAPLVQFTINGTFNTLAQKNTYLLAPTANSAAGVTVAGGATWNILSTTNNLPTGQPIPTGSICVTTTNRTANPETINGAILVLGTLNINGAGFWCNSNFSLDTSDRTATGTGCTVNLNNATFRLGTATNGALNSIYTDYYRGTGLNQLFTFNISNSNIIDTYLKFLAVKPSSTFTNVRWFKTIPQTTTQATNLDIAIAITPLSSGLGYNFNGPIFRLNADAATEYNTHIATGITSSNGSGRQSAIRNTIYGYEIGLLPKIGKVVDFPGYRCWFEGRKNLALTVLDATGSNVTGAGTYLEDTNQHTGQLATANIIALSGQNTGFNNGTFTSGAGLIPGGGTNGQVTITVSGGRVVNAAISNAGSGYSAVNGSGLQIAVNNTNFPGAGAGTQPCTIYVWPHQRYASYTSTTPNTCPDFSGNRVYLADVSSGILNTTQTNSGASGTALSAGNPVVPNGSAYTGLDLLLWAANAGYNDLASTWGSAQGLAPIDNRWSANASTAYLVNIPIRGYAYIDNSFTLTEANGGGATAQTNQTLILNADTYINATGIAEATAGGYSDITLTTVAPTRNATTFALVQTSTGTLNTTIARNLDQVGAKTKWDYSRRALNTTAGTVARTGFGMSSFIANSGTFTNATLSIGSWNANLVGKQTQGTVYKTLSTIGNVALSGQATAAADNGISVVANRITLGTAGVAASWTTTFGSITPPASSTSNVVVTVSGLGAFVSGGSISTPAYTVAGGQTAAAILNDLAARLTGALITGGATTATVTPGFSGSTNASFILTLTADGSTGTFSNVGTITFGAVLTAVGFPATMQVYSGLGISTGSTAATSVAAGFNASGSRPAGWNAVASGTGNTGVITFTGPAIWSGTPAPTFTDTAGTPGTRTIAFSAFTNGAGGSPTLTFNLPAIAGPVTPAPVFSGSGIGSIYNSPSNGTIISSTASTLGTTVFQNLTATQNIALLPLSGQIATGVTLGFGTSSAINLTGDITFTNCILSGMCSLNIGATNRTLTLNNCGTLTSFPFSRSGTADVNVIFLGNTVFSGTLPTGFVANISTTVTLSFTDSPTVAPAIRVAEVYKNSGTLITLGTPTFANSQYTWTIGSALTDVYSGAVFLVDGYQVTRGTAIVNTAVNATASPEPNVDFGQTLAAIDTNFIATTAFDTTNYALASNAYLRLTTSTAIDYTTTPTTRTAVEKAKLVLRRTFETNAAGTVSFRSLIARGLIATSAITFTQTGFSLPQITGLETSGLGIQINKAASNSAVVTIALWVIDNLGDFYNTNNANARTTTSPTTLILFEGFSPGAVASLNSGQINQVATGVATNLVGTQGSPGALGKIADGVNKASLVIPAGINLYN